MLDLLLACLHHVVVFSLVGLFAAEFALLRPGLTSRQVVQLSGIDLAYGIVAGLVLVVGVLRVVFGASGWSYYAGNHAFWGKMAALVVVGLLSIPPTIAIQRWKKAGKTDPAFVPADTEVQQQRRFIHLQAGFLLLVPIFAAAMARGYGG